LGGALGGAAVASFAGGPTKAAKPAAKSGGKGDIIEIEGIGPTYAAKLKKAKIEWIRELRERGRTKAGRGEIAEQSGIDEKLILTWVNMADLQRVEGMTPDFAELMHAAGVDTVRELATRVPANLHKALVEANSGAKKISAEVPGEALVEKFVAKAKTMPAGVEH
jgi:predicted flap endonuclease-1-like 5' DNA nuclease